MNARAQGTPLSKPPDLPDPMIVKNASDYAGTYSSDDRRKIVVVAESDRLTMRVGSQSVPLQSAGATRFSPQFRNFSGSQLYLAG
jgi:hypothetical protein